MKVYIVTRGEYSDYHICAVFTKRKDAAKYIERTKRVDDWLSEEKRIETWPLDQPPEEWVLTLVWMDDALNVLRTYQSSGVEDKAGFYAWGNLSGKAPELGWHVATDSVERAVKVVAEKAAQIKALGLWGKALHGRVK